MAAQRPFMNLGTVDVYRKAEIAARCGDARTLDGCISELRHRKRGEDLIEDLEELRAEVNGLHGSLPDLTKSFSPTDVANLTILTDNDCHRRLDLLRDARRSIWLSTYSITDDHEDLRNLLRTKVRNGVKVNLIVSKRPANGNQAAEVINDLRKDSVRVTVTTNHSKCAVVDDEHVMIGSANLQTKIRREVALQFRSASVARMLIEYFDKLIHAAG